MSGSVNDTPSVKFKLDDSERLRLEKVRSRLQLTDWDRIKKEYTLAPDAGVAKKISALATTNPILHDEKYGLWSNRFTDFDVHWEKTRDDATQVVKGQLVATGKMRLEHLGKLGEGAKVVLMAGPINANPMPCTTVAALRINHVLLDIEFPQAREIENAHADDIFSKTFKVGKNNCLYGSNEQKTNKKKFKTKQDAKRGIVPTSTITSIIAGVFDYAAEKERIEKLRKEENEIAEEEGSGEDSDHHKDDEAPPEATPQFWNNYASHGGIFQHARNNGSSSRSYQPSFNMTPEMKDALDMTSKMTTGKTNSVPTEATQQKNNESVDEDMAFNELVITPVLQESIAGLSQVGFMLKPPGRESL